MLYTAPPALSACAVTMTGCPAGAVDMFRLADAASTNWAYASDVVLTPKCAAVWIEKYLRVPVSVVVGVSVRVIDVPAGTLPVEVAVKDASAGAMRVTVPAPLP